MRSRVVMVLAVAAIVLGGVLLVPAAYAKFSGGDDPTTKAGPTPTVPPPTVPPTIVEPPQPTLAAGPVSVKVDGFFSWAMLDRRTNAISGSPNSAKARSSTESMIKVWIVSDFLRRAHENGEMPSKERLDQARRAIRDSDDNAAGALYSAGGGTAVTRRMISKCGLTNTRLGSVPGYVGWWSFTEMSAQDATRLGLCVKEGKAAGPKWTQWVLTEMTKVRGTTAAKDQHETYGGGRWGIIDGLPNEIVKRSPVSIKNGWTSLAYDGNWHISCLAITDDWILAVQTRYPAAKGLKYGAGVCGSVASQLVTPKVGAALRMPAAPGGAQG
jgi:hypothetical protein